MGQLKLVHFKETKELTFSRDRKSYCVSKNKLPNEHSAWFYLLLNVADPKVYITFWLDFTAVSPRGPSITESVFQPPPPPTPFPFSQLGILFPSWAYWYCYIIYLQKDAHDMYGFSQTSP